MPQTTVTLSQNVPTAEADALGLASGVGRQTGAVLQLDTEIALRLVREDYAQFGSAAEDAANTGTIGQRPVRRASATLDFPSVAAGGKQALPVTVAGAKVGELVAVAGPGALDAGIVLGGKVSAANTVTVTAANTTGAAIDPASGAYTVAVINSARK